MALHVSAHCDVGAAFAVTLENEFVVDIGVVGATPNAFARWLQTPS